MKVFVRFLNVVFDRFRLFVIFYGFKYDIVLLLDEVINLDGLKCVVDSVSYVDGLCRMDLVLEVVIFVMN